MASCLLSILIPTYNRAECLEKNLQQLADITKKAGFSDEIEIIVSNNCSNDHTKEVLYRYMAVVTAYSQENNIGLEKNALFLMKVASGKYVMYLGDDDFLHPNYLEKVICLLKSDDPPAVIIPSIIGITKAGEVLLQRNIGAPSRLYGKGKRVAALKMHLGHQLSGLVFLKEGLVDEYEMRKVDNIYPFIFFAGFCAMKGDLYHLTYCPVSVTEGAKKDWGYGDDGLICDIFRNYLKLFGKVSIYRIIAEYRLIFTQAGRIAPYFRHGIKYLFKHYCAIFSCKNISIVFKVTYFPLSIALIIRQFSVGLLKRALLDK